MIDPDVLRDDTIYLDHAATTPVDPDVLPAMLPYFGEHFGNPSSIYRLGQEARAAVDRSRLMVARVLGCHPDEILFTSGATEADNLALKGVAWQARLQRSELTPHVVVTEIEHHAVLHAADALAEEGFAVSRVPPDSDGLIDPRAVLAALRPETCLVSVMLANNETGAIQPLQDISAICRERGVFLHTDAVQAAGVLPLRVDDLGCDLLSLSAHKFYGPKGVGVLYVRRGTPMRYLQNGGGQEAGRRGGTENVAGIVGLAAALVKAEALRPRESVRLAQLRDRLWASIRESLSGATINGPSDPAKRLPQHLNLAIPGVQGETVLLALDMEGVAASAGSACTTGNTEPSHVLLAMGLSDERCRASLRLTVGRTNTFEQMDEAAAVLTEVVNRVRSLAVVG